MVSLAGYGYDLKLPKILRVKKVASKILALWLETPLMTLSPTKLKSLPRVIRGWKEPQDIYYLLDYLQHHQNRVLIHNRVSVCIVGFYHQLLQIAGIWA